MNKLKMIRQGKYRLKIYVKEPYVEKFTECDRCQNLDECKKLGFVLETTSGLDRWRHFIKGIGVLCKKDI